MKRTSLFTVIFALSMLFVFAAPASALVLNQDTCPGNWTWDTTHTTGICDIDSDNVFVINEDITIDRDTVLNNFGSIIISNHSTIYQQDIAIFNRYSGTIDNYGTFANGGLANYGTINNKNGGILNNITIENHGKCGGGQPVDTSDDCEKTKGIINNSGTFTNGKLYNYPNGTITNLGTITGSGTIINNGTINNTESGIISNIFGDFSSDGMINNWGTITNTAGGNFYNEETGEIKNSGNINNHDGNFTNEGSITNNDGGTIINEAGGTIRDPDGKVYVLGDFINDAEGVIFNNIGGTIEITSGMKIKNKGKIHNNFVIQNNGTIDNDGNINNYYNIIGGNILNFGSITNADGGIITTPFLVHGLSIINSGGITNSGIISNFDIDNSGIITNNAGGTITIRDYDYVTNFNGGSITNNGGTITNNGDITNNAGGTINNENGGIINNEENGNIINIGIFSNKATIYNKTGATIFNAGIFNNDGIIYNRSGANISNNIGGTIINGGNTIINEEGGNIANYGTITNDATGVIRNLGSFTNEGTISNNGTIYSSSPIGGTIIGTPPIIDNIPPTTTDDTPSTWQNTDFTVKLTCTDNTGGSGCKETNYSIDGGDFKTGTSISINAEGDHLIEYYSIDILDNKEAVKSIHAKLDKTSPSISSLTPMNGGTYTLNQAIASSYICSDSGSGIATCDGPLSSGSNFDTSTVGLKSFIVNAQDNAGNTASATNNYNVIYNWNGFFPPVDNIPTLNTVKAGSAIPMKFNLSGNQSLNIFSLGYPASQKIDCDSNAPIDKINKTVTTGQSNLSYDATIDQYNYVWKTDKAWSGTCRQIILRLIDGTDHIANFKFR